MRCDLLCGPQTERIIDVKLLVQKRRENRERIKARDNWALRDGSMKKRKQSYANAALQAMD
jgi:hypothetical protein